MAIAFTCPHCGEPYRLKDDLAGKRATCKKATCRKPFVVPAPVKGAVNGSATVPADAEAVAAAAFLADEATNAPKKSLGTMKVTCPGCDHTWEVDRALEGKNVPCPECKRIVKVPVLKEEKPADWRTGKGGPSLARRDKEKPEGAWETERTYAKQQSLIQAGAIETGEELEPVSKVRRAWQVMLLLAVVGSVAFGVIILTKNRKEVRQERSLADAVKEVESAEGLPNRPLLEAAILRSAGEQRVRAIASLKDLEEAEGFLTRAAGKLRESPAGSAERDGLLIEVAEQMVNLGGSKEEVAQEKRRDWVGGSRDTVQIRLRQTLQALSPDRDLKLMALRQIARKLATKQQGEVAVPIAREIIREELGEAIGQIGVELFAANQKDAAKRVLDEAVAALSDTPDKAAQAPALTALRLALGGDQPIAAGKLPALVRPAGGQLPDPVRMAYASGLACQGKFDQARQLAEQPGGTPEGRARAMLAVAEIAVAAGKAEEGAPAAGTAAKFVAQEMKASLPSKWVMIRLAALAARGGNLDAAHALVDLLSDESAKSWGRLEVMRGRLASQPKQAAPDSWLEELGDPAKPNLGQALGREAIARHNAGLGDGAYAKTVDSWKGVLKAFGSAGVTLGTQDRSLR